MAQVTHTKSKKAAPPRGMKNVIEELRLLRETLMLLLPQEDLKDYKHPERIKRSYQKALKKYPPVSS